jgi:SAM-dependent methyltransferase
MTRHETNRMWPLDVYRHSLKKKDKFKQIFLHVPLNASDVVLDVGCANGVFSYLIQDRVGELHALEPNAEYLDQARNLVEHAHFYHQTAVPLPFRDTFFDKALLLDVLYYTDEQATIAELFRVLKPGGMLIVSLPFLHPTFSLRWFKKILHVDLRHEGGSREGYDVEMITTLFGRGKWSNIDFAFHSILFVELFENLFNWLRRKKHISSQTSVAEGGVVSSTSYIWYKRMYWLLLPLVWIDHLLRACGAKGHGIIVFMQKEALI